jgi:VIT1/CCC1 family predicted Fe2+/Mn2+ transporter
MASSSGAWRQRWHRVDRESCGRLAAAASRQDVLVAGVAGLVAGALSMAAGEYVSVSSQADTEKADLTRERHELATEPQAEEDELTGIYVRRGLDPKPWSIEVIVEFSDERRAVAFESI